jgi:hypothetical protein
LVGFPLGFWSVIVLSALFSVTPILPALALGGIRLSAAFCLRFVAAAGVVALPWLLVIEVLGLPAQFSANEGWGMLEGGIILWPLLGGHMFLATTAATVIPTVVYVAMKNGGGATHD